MYNSQQFQPSNINQSPPENEEFARYNMKSELCNRCKCKAAQYLCGECSPFNVFCESCDNYVHSLPSKRTHHRNLMISSKTNNNFPGASTNLSSVDTNCMSQSPRFSHNNNNNNNNNNNPNNSSTNQVLLDNNNIPLNTASQGYLNEIKQIYESEKAALEKRNMQWQREIHDSSRNYNDKIAYWEHSLSEQTQKNAMEVKILIDNHEDEIKRIVAEKDGEINYLYNQNIELEKANEALVNKVNEYAEIMNQTQVNSNEKVSNYENTIASLNLDCEELKNFYEKKIAFISQNFSSEKNKIINSYENTIDKWTSGYNETKDGYVGVIRQRDDEIKELIISHRNDTDKLNAVIQGWRAQVDSMKDDQEKLWKWNAEQKAEISVMNENLEKAKKEIKFHIKRKTQVEEDAHKLKASNNLLLIENNKMNRLTHGKFKRKNSQ